MDGNVANPHECDHGYAFTLFDQDGTDCFEGEITRQMVQICPSCGTFLVRVRFAGREYKMNFVLCDPHAVLAASRHWLWENPVLPLAADLDWLPDRLKIYMPTVEQWESVKSAAQRLLTERVVLRAALLAAKIHEDRANDARQHTWEYVRQRYGALETWAREDLPEPWSTKFFSTLANGTPEWTHPGYPEEKVSREAACEQFRRAEDAELKLAELRRRLADLHQALGEANGGLGVLEQIQDQFSDLFEEKQDA